MALKYVSEQKFGKWSRFLVTFEKVSEQGGKTVLIRPEEEGEAKDFRETYFLGGRREKRARREDVDGTAAEPGEGKPE